jgi:TonB family protein
MDDVAIHFEEPFDEEAGDFVDANDRAYGSPTTHAVPAPERLTIAGRLARGYAAAPIAFTTALAVHAAVIVAGLYYLRVTRPPQADRPFGWTVERDGPGSAGASAAAESTLAEPSQVSLHPPPSSGDTDAPAPRQPLGPPPGEFQPPDVTPRASRLDPLAGTADPSPLSIALAANPTPPAFAPRTPPGFDKLGERQGEPADGSGAAAGTSATAPSSGPPTQPQQVPSPPVNAAQTAIGDSAADPAGGRDGGGPRGSPSGQDSGWVQCYYPARALENGWGGTVGARFDVDDRGKVRRVKVIQSSGHDVLDEAVVDALYRSKAPQYLWGSVGKTIPFNFNPPPRQLARTPRARAITWTIKGAGLSCPS